MEIKTVALLGAGAVGAYFIYGLSELKEIDFCVVAEGERKIRLERDGVAVNHRTYYPTVRTPEECKGVDLLLIAMKYYGLPDALDTIRTIVGPDTVVMSLLNGIDSEEIVSRVVPRSQIVYSLMRISSRRDGNSSVFDPDKTAGVYFGEYDCDHETPRILAIERLFDKGLVHYKFIPDILREQWSKFLINITYNLPQAVFGVGYGAYFDSEHVAYIRDRLEQEVRAVAASYGITMDPLMNQAHTHGKDVRFSTLQDLDAKRPTEIEMFLGVFMKKAKEANIEVPFSEYTYHAILALEEKNSGKFDYGEK